MTLCTVFSDFSKFVVTLFPSSSSKCPSRSKKYDAFLKYVYNDYMTLPPKEKRTPHAPVSSFNFNVQSKSVDREKVK